MLRMLQKDGKNDCVWLCLRKHLTCKGYFRIYEKNWIHIVMNIREEKFVRKKGCI